jgi:hypothetical protein
VTVQIADLWFEVENYFLDFLDALRRVERFETVAKWGR